MTLIEILVGIVIAGMIMGPLGAWAFGTLRTQSVSKDELGRANATGLLNTYFLRDVASSRQVLLESDGAADCASVPGPVPPSAGGRVVVRLIQAGTGTRSVVYSEVGGDASNPAVLWRRVCGATGELVEATKVFSRVVRGSVSAGCPEPTDTAKGACGTSRRVSLVLRPWVPASASPRPEIVVSATRRAGDDAIGLASSSPPDARLVVDPVSGYRGTVFTARSESVDLDGDPLTVTWTLPPGAVTSDPLTGDSIRFTLAQSGNIVMVVSDGRSAVTAEKSIRIVNRTPTVVSAACSLVGGRTMVLNTSVADDDGDPLTLEWTAPDGSAIPGADGAQWTVPAALSGLQMVTLVASDGDASSTGFALCDVPGAVVQPGGVDIDPDLINGSYINAIPQDGSLAVTFTAVEPFPPGSSTGFELYKGGGATPARSVDDQTTWTVPFAPGDWGAYEIVRVTRASDGQVTRGDRIPFRVNAAPRASVRVTAAAGEVPDRLVSFDAVVSDPDGTIASEVWDFGDGTPLVTDPERPVNHTYTAAGTYTATLRVTDADGAVTTVTTTVDVPEAT